MERSLGRVVMPIRPPQRFAGAIFLLIALLAVSPRRALAHAVLLSSTPQKNVVVSGPDLAISLKYNSRVDGARSSLSLLKPDGTGLRCVACHRLYPVRDEIPVMLIDEAIIDE